MLKKKDLGAEKFLITAGPNREPLDPVRYISNRSSGKMGYALARAAVRRGAEVALISGPTSLEPPSGARVIAVTTAAEMRDAVLKEYSQCTAVIMAAAVADYHAAAVAEKKIKRGRGPVELRLEPSPDILKELGQNKDGQWLVGLRRGDRRFDCQRAEKIAREKSRHGGRNNVAEDGSGFDGDTNIATIVDRSGATRSLPLMSKDDLADCIYDHYLALKSPR